MCKENNYIAPEIECISIEPQQVIAQSFTEGTGTWDASVSSSKNNPFGL